MSKHAIYGYLLKTTVNSIITPPEENEELVDLQIMRRVLQLFTEREQTIDYELEIGLLQFALIFKNQVLSHSRMLDIGYSMITDQNQESDINDAKSLDLIANMLGF